MVLALLKWFDMVSNKSLHAANKAKNDEFYTQLSDIEKELRHYKHHFKNKTVYCNCDDPSASNFFRYFHDNFKHLRLKKLIASGYKTENTEHGVWSEYSGDGDVAVKPLKGDGDFRSEECVNLLKQADIVVTNPPFSLFREYVAQLVEYGKKFLIIGNKNAITYKEIFPLIKDDKMWLGVTPMGTDMLFGVPEHYAETLVQTKKSGSSYRIIDGEVKARAQACWFTNLDHDKRHEELILYKRYTSEEYPHYDNYDAVDVSKVAEIPCDFDGAMGVPITFLDKYNPEQFEIIKFRKGNDEQDLSINGKCPYFRILIKKNVRRNNHENPNYHALCLAGVGRSIFPMCRVCLSRLILRGVGVRRFLF